MASSSSLQLGQSDVLTLDCASDGRNHCFPQPPVRQVKHLLVIKKLWTLTRVVVRIHENRLELTLPIYEDYETSFVEQKRREKHHRIKVAPATRPLINGRTAFNMLSIINDYFLFNSRPITMQANMRLCSVSTLHNENF